MFDPSSLKGLVQHKAQEIDDEVIERITVFAMPPTNSPLGPCSNSNRKKR